MHRESSQTQKKKKKEKKEKKNCMCSESLDVACSQKTHLKRQRDRDWKCELGGLGRVMEMLSSWIVVTDARL